MMAQDILSFSLTSFSNAWVTFGQIVDKGPAWHGFWGAIIRTSETSLVCLRIVQHRTGRQNLLARSYNFPTTTKMSWCCKAWHTPLGSPWKHRGTSCIICGILGWSYNFPIAAKMPWNRKAGNTSHRVTVWILCGHHRGILQCACGIRGYIGQFLAVKNMIFKSYGTRT